MAVDPISARPERKVWKAGELARRIRGLLEAEIGWVWIEGECSNVRPAASGHVYFTLKDEIGQIQSALFRGDALACKVRPRDGLKVRVYGQVTAYEKTSQYQVIVRRVEEAGAGDLHAAFEKLKARLLAEGLFAAARKRPLPVLPRVIGIVTSPQGAALRDMLTVLNRRFPNRHLLIAPCRVQGAGAAEEIAAALRLLSEDGRAEVILAGP
ncbi:MAG: exodeoxyribonuclease VII large subunit [Kiritimatiellia bacterium]